MEKRMQKQITELKDKINEMFPAVNEKYPVAMIVDDRLLISGETHVKVECEGEMFEGLIVDYYGEFRGNYPWVDESLVKYLKKIGYGYEWENPGCIVVFNDN